MEPTTLDTIVPAAPPASATPVTSTGGNLPRTGSQPFSLVLVGAGLVGTGASLLAWRRSARERGAATDA
ncbi:MAG: LPXTG cell wall anchor domain-containing protein [Acidimicrobiales bacterium]